MSDRDEWFDADGRPVRRKPPRFADEPPPRTGPSVDDLICDAGGMASAVPFRERDGGPVLYLLPTGAFVSNNGVGPVFHRAPQPADGYASLTARRRYHAVCLARDEAAFKLVKGILTGSSGHYEWNAKAHGPQPGRPGQGWLIRLREHVHRHRAAVADLDRRIAETPEATEAARREQKRREREAAVASATDDARLAIEAVTLD